MDILIGLAAGVALLYFWLIGHWFARILAHLTVMPLLAVILAVSLHGSDPPGQPVGSIAGITIGLIAGWFIASVPVYWRRHIERRERLRHYLAMQNLNTDSADWPLVTTVARLAAPPVRWP